jgi:hypothetical protein
MTRALQVFMLVASMLVVVPAGAQDIFCIPCGAQLWQNIEKQLLRRANNVKEARQMLRQAEQSGNPDLITTMQALLAKTTAEWVYLDTLARELGSNSYKSYLARNQVDVERRFDEARSALHRKTEQFDRLRKRLAEHRESALREMEGITEEEAQQCKTLAKDSSFGALEALGHGAEENLKELRARTDRSADVQRRILDLEQFVSGVTAIRGGRIGHELASREYWDAAAETSQMALEKIIPRLAVSAGYLEATTALPFFVKFTLDLAAIGQSHQQFAEAEARLNDIGNSELHWQTDIRALGARVNQLREEQALATDTIQRQLAFEQNVAKIRAEVAP